MCAPRARGGPTSRKSRDLEDSHRSMTECKRLAAGLARVPLGSFEGRRVVAAVVAGARERTEYSKTRSHACAPTWDIHGNSSSIMVLHRRFGDLVVNRRFDGVHVLTIGQGHSSAAYGTHPVRNQWLLARSQRLTIRPVGRAALAMTVDDGPSNLPPFGQYPVDSAPGTPPTLLHDRERDGAGRLDGVHDGGDHPSQPLPRSEPGERAVASGPTSASRPWTGDFA